MAHIAKYISSCIILTYLSTQQNYAIENNHEISIGYGLNSIYDYDCFINEDDGAPDEYEDINHTRTINLEYLYRRNRVFSFGCVISYSCQTFEHNLFDYGSYRYDSSTKNKFVFLSDYYYVAAKTKRHRLAIMPKTHIRWFEKSHVSMYSKIAAGICRKIVKEQPLVENYKKEEETCSKFALQISPVCITAGSEKIRFFFEMGFGSQAALEAGVSYRFGK